MKTETQFKILLLPMGVFPQSCMGMKIPFLFFKIYFYNKLTVKMLPLSIFMNNIAVLCINIIREKLLFWGGWVGRWCWVASSDGASYCSKAVLLLWFLTVTCSCCPYLYFCSTIMLVTYFSKF